VDEKLNRAKQEIRKNKKSLRNSSKIAISIASNSRENNFGIKRRSTKEKSLYEAACV